MHTLDRPRTILATFVAGPTFVVALMLASWLDGGADAIHLGSPTTMLIALPILAMSSAFGAIIALIPCLLGGWALDRLSRRNIGVRLPVMWGLAEAAFVGVPAILYTSDGLPLFALTATGAICALVCRHRVEWQTISLCQIDQARLTAPHDS